MSRVEDNNRNINDLLDLLKNNLADLEGAKVSILADISQSLAIIADNTSYLDPLHNLRMHSESPKTSDQQVTY